MDHKKRARNLKILVREIVVKDFVHQLAVKQKNLNQILKCLVTVKLINLHLTESFWI